jgi:hypothetical protein
MMGVIGFLMVCTAVFLQCLENAPERDYPD